MILGTKSRKFALTTHVVVSVGWIGAIACFLVLAVAGVASRDRELVQAAYRAMQLITWTIIVPMAFASLLTGILSSLGTRWGLFRHYWVILKLLTTVLATGVLLIHTQPIDQLAMVTVGMGVVSASFAGQQWMMVTAAAVAIIALVVLAVLSVYKPQGLTRYGARKWQAQNIRSGGTQV